MDSLDFYFKHSIKIQVSGRIRCEQTRLVRRILEKQLIQPFATRIIWVYSEWQPDYDMIRIRYFGIEFEKGWRDDIFYSLTPEQRYILVWDDQMGVASSSKSVSDLFTKGSNHKNLTVIYLVQNLYNQGKSQRTIILNFHYSVVFRNGREASQFRTMAYQICPSNGHWLTDAFTNATSKPYEYFVLDHHTLAPEDQAVATNILPGKQVTDYINSHLPVRRH